ncbi:helix-turn-helix transcriptional regulator [Streptomyces anulatus]|uniref:Transcriptional regulator n=1 Tax=Streptomyces microflavus DSM 40593 TaxID=1303692 RepID=N0CWE8_STRMI|nr:helix-turn-helix transcriptional regulator [Streptomyces microflavus]AGK80451.1 Putative transcriptional regulator [Streptomyces microflavus DSM 40593]
MLNKDAMRELRNERQMSRAELAQKLDRHPLTIRRWETGRMQPNSHTVVVIAEVLGCDVEDLVAVKE